MDPLLSFITQPWMIVLIAVTVFTGRVVILARSLKSGARRASLADTLALEEAQKALNSHRASLDMAKDTVAQNIGGARETLREYKRPLNTSIESRKREIAASMASREKQKKDFDALRDQKPFKDAKKLVKDAIPRAPRHAPKDI